MYCRFSQSVIENVKRAIEFWHTSCRMCGGPEGVPSHAADWPPAHVRAERRLLARPVHRLRVLLRRQTREANRHADCEHRTA